MFHKNNEHQDEEWHEQPIQQPDVNELGVGGCGQVFAYGSLQCVHDQHGCDDKRNGTLEMLFLEINSNLKYMKIHTKVPAIRNTTLKANISTLTIGSELQTEQGP